MEPKTHTIDAKGKKLGRVASAIAHLLMEKDSVHFEKHQKIGARVTVVNASKLSISEKKLSEKEYANFTGHVGGLSFDTMRELVARHGYRDILYRAVRRMIPANKLRPGMLKRLSISE
ncbi:MAG: 50S ribosomal protein L13 [Patescibacteria group bacterium]